MNVILLKDVEKLGLRGRGRRTSRAGTPATSCCRGSSPRSRRRAGSARSSASTPRRRCTRRAAPSRPPRSRPRSARPCSGSTSSPARPARCSARSRTTDIADEIWRTRKIRVDRRKIGIDDIKRIGRYTVPVDVFEGVSAEVKLMVVPEGGELPPEEELAAMEAAEAAAAGRGGRRRARRARSRRPSAALAEESPRRGSRRRRRSRSRTSRRGRRSRPRTLGPSPRSTDEAGPRGGPSGPHEPVHTAHNAPPAPVDGRANLSLAAEIAPVDNSAAARGEASSGAGDRMGTYVPFSLHRRCLVTRWSCRWHVPLGQVDCRPVTVAPTHRCRRSCRRRTSRPRSPSSARCCSRRPRSAPSPRCSSASDFYRESHGTIYRAALALYGKGEPVDAITLANELDERSELERVGGTAQDRRARRASCRRRRTPSTTRGSSRRWRRCAGSSASARRSSGSARRGPARRPTSSTAPSRWCSSSPQERVSGDFAHIHDLLNESFARIMHLYEAGVDVTGVPSRLPRARQAHVGLPARQPRHHRRAAVDGEVRARALHRREPRPSATRRPSRSSRSRCRSPR